MSASPSITQPRDSERRIRLKGELPNPAIRPTGCYFHPRCRYAPGKKILCAYRACAASARKRTFAACHFAEELNCVAQLLKLLQTSERQSTLTGPISIKAPYLWHGGDYNPEPVAARKCGPRFPPDAKGRRFRARWASLAGFRCNLPRISSRSIGSMKF